jgi:uncharacterized membrane protein YeaQ/YmgE (transglycosylase-associated protein family)
MSLLAWAFVGLIAGAIAQRVIDVDRRGCLGTMVIGVLGALVGGGLYRAVRGDEVEVYDEVDLRSVLVAIVGSVALLLVLEAIGGRGRASSRRRRRH